MTTICHLTIVHQSSIPRLLREAESAINSGFRVIIISPGNSYTREDGLIIQGLEKPLSRLERFIRTDKQVFKIALNSKADIFQIHDPELLRYALRLKKTGAKVIFDSHEFYSLQILTKFYIPRFIRKPIRFLYEKYETFILKKIDYTIGVCTLGGVNIFEERGIRNSLIENFPMFKNTHLGSNVIKKKQVVYAGLLSEGRGIANIIKASYLAGVKLALCGPWINTEYKNLITSMKEYNVVNYYGVIDRESVEKIYSESMIGLSTYLYEGQNHVVDTMPTKVFEFMNANLPVIISNTAYFHSINTVNQFAIGVDPSNITQISDAISILVKDEPLRDQLGNNGKDLIKNRFSWNIEEKKLLKVYRLLTEIE